MKIKNNNLIRKIYIPSDINIELLDNILILKGNLGIINFKIIKYIKISLFDKYILIQENNVIYNKRINIKSLINTNTSVIKNILIGINIGYTKELIIFGIGYKAEIINNFIILNLGYSHLINYKIPENINIICKNNEIIIKGIDKQLVGQVASKIRNFKKPDSYKGKGIRYKNEKIITKSTKRIK